MKKQKKGSQANDKFNEEKFDIAGNNIQKEAKTSSNIAMAKKIDVAEHDSLH